MKQTILIIIFLLAMAAPSSESDFRGAYSFMPDIAIDLSESPDWAYFSNKESVKRLSYRLCDCEDCRLFFKK